MERLQREMNRLFDSYSTDRQRSAPSYPAMNVWTKDDEAVLTAEVPGVTPEDIQISVVGETLTLSGERPAIDLDEDARYHRRERGYGRFTRSVQLPFRVDADAVAATFKNGILHVNLPRAEEDKPKRITVKAA
jgi:HSP20 family protein